MPAWHLSPAVQALASSHTVPSGLAPLSMQTLLPPAQVSTPDRQGFLGKGQLPPATQVVQMPLEHTLPPAQTVPSSALPLSTQVRIPVEQDHVPLWQLAETGQLSPATHWTHWPAWHTMPVPQIVPLAAEAQMPGGASIDWAWSRVGAT